MKYSYMTNVSFQFVTVLVVGLCLGTTLANTNSQNSGGVAAAVVKNKPLLLKGYKDEQQRGPAGFDAVAYSRLLHKQTMMISKKQKLLGQRRAEGEGTCTFLGLDDETTLVSDAAVSEFFSVMLAAMINGDSELDFSEMELYMEEAQEVCNGLGGSLYKVSFELDGDCGFFSYDDDFTGNDNYYFGSPLITEIKDIPSCAAECSADAVEISFEDVLAADNCDNPNVQVTSDAFTIAALNNGLFSRLVVGTIVFGTTLAIAMM